jgi:hypothetical protein
MRAKRTSLIPWRSVALYEYVPSTKTQNEENRAVMRRELLCAVWVFKDEVVATRWGAYEAAVAHGLVLAATVDGSHFADQTLHR